MDIARTSAVATSLTTTALGATWLVTGTANPLDHPGRPFSSALAGYPDGWANPVFLGCAFVALAAALWPRRVPVWAAVTAIVALLVLMDASTLMAAGYLPAVLIGSLLGLGEATLSLLVSPGLLVQLLLLATVAAFGALVARRVRTTVSDDLERATARTRRWTRIAVEAPLVYALTRVLMFFCVPGFAMFPFGSAILWAGLGLAVSASLGAWLTCGLVRPWGEVFPRWLPWLRGRRVPIRLAVVPGLLVAVMVATASKDLFLSLDDGGLTVLAEWPLVALPGFLWPLWAFALAMATANYGIRRSLTEAKISKHQDIEKMVYIPSTGTRSPKISGN